MTIEATVLSVLDGGMQTNYIVNLATTNYPKKLDPRITQRPRRFDGVVKVGMPTDETRRQYINLKTTSFMPERVERLVTQSSGLSLAALAEAIISTQCLGLGLNETLGRLKEMNTNKFSIDESDDIGFVK